MDEFAKIYGNFVNAYRNVNMFLKSIVEETLAI